MADLKEIQTTYWDKQFLVKEVKTGENTMMQISLAQKKGTSYLVYREFYNTKTNPDWLPSKHGGATKIEIAGEVLSAMIDGLQKAKKLGWVK